MGSFSTADRLLLGVLLPLWLVFLGFHVKEINRTGFAGPPIYAAASAESTGYPTIGGFPMERGRGDGALEVGDVLIRVGDTDLRGVGYLGFDAIALEEAGTSLETTVVYERGGDRRSTSLTMLSSGLSFYRVVPVLSWVLVVTLILVRRHGENASGSRLLFAATLCVALLTTPFFGGPRWQSYLSLWVFHAIGGVAFILSLRWALQFPHETPARARLSPHWCWLGGLWWIVRIGYFQPALLPPGLTPRLSLGFDVLFILGMLAIVTHNSVHAGPIGRRRVKWLVLSSYLGVGPLAGFLLVPLVAPDFAYFDLLFEIGVMLFVLVPVGLLIAILRYNLYDIDRLISVTASYSFLSAMLAGSIPIVVPAVAEAATSAIGVNQQGTQVVLAAALAALLLPAHQWLRPLIERVAFPERRAFEDGVQRLLEELSTTARPQELAERTGAGLDALLRPETCIIYARTEHDFSPIFVRSTRPKPPDPIPLDSPLIAVLGRRRSPVAVEASPGWRGKSSRQSPFERAALEDLDAEVVAPIRGRRELTTFLCLGKKRSGDVYTSIDVALLATVAERVSTELLLFEDSGAPGHGRAETVRRVTDDPGSGEDRFRYAPDAPAARHQPPAADSASPDLMVTLTQWSLAGECPTCFTCYDAGARRCERDGAALTSMPCPRYLDGRYRLDRRIGQGGMGAVYEATDTSLERVVAIKVIREELAGRAEAAERFRREARATAGFAHRHAVTVHDFGVAPGGVPFLVMERLDGLSLRDALADATGLGPSRTVAILRGVCAAVEAAHARQLIHRDLKPANIFLAQADGDEVVKVLDFGLAKFLSASARTDAETQPGLVVGTVPYMAPERFLGEDASTRWDVWSLAVVAYEMLAGGRPFTGPSASRIQMDIMSGRMTPLGTYLPAAPASWHAFFERALARDPDERPDTARRLYAELEELLGQPPSP